MKQRSNRREFLKGRSLVHAVQQVVEDFEFDIPDSMIDIADAKQASWLETFEKKAMACDWELMFNMQEYQQSGLVADKAMQQIDHLEAQLTIYDEDSEVSDLNRRAFEQPVSVEESLFDLLLRAQSIH